MSETPAPREAYRSFTLRVPMSLYSEMSERAINDKMFLNQKATQLIRLGLGEAISIDAAVARMLRDTIARQGDE